MPFTAQIPKNEIHNRIHTNPCSLLTHPNLLHSLIPSPNTQQPNNSTSTFDPYSFLHIILNPDGTITRPDEFYPTVAPNTSLSALSKDTPLNPDKSTWVRIFLPNGSDPIRPGSLPIIIFVHGGGFVLLSAASPMSDTFCSNAASQLSALVISVEYRLAPENRLPAAYDDVFDALTWAKQGNDEWVVQYGDFSRCVLMGESAGGNAVYTVGLKVASLIDEIKPLVVQGFVLIQPAFGGVKLTESELRLENDTALPLAVNELLWELALPIGADTDHPYSNPVLNGGSGQLEKIRDLGWRVMVVSCDGDPLFDRAVQLSKLLEKKGVDVVTRFTQGGYHGMYTVFPEKGEILFKIVESVFSPVLVE